MKKLREIVGKFQEGFNRWRDHSFVDHAIVNAIGSLDEHFNRTGETWLKENRSEKQYQRTKRLLQEINKKGKIQRVPVEVCLGGYKLTESGEKEYEIIYKYLEK